VAPPRLGVWWLSHGCLDVVDVCGIGRALDVVVVVVMCGVQSSLAVVSKVGGVQALPRCCCCGGFGVMDVNNGGWWQ